MAVGALLAGIAITMLERPPGSSPASEPQKAPDAAGPVVPPPRVPTGSTELLKQAEPLLKAGNPEGMNLLELFLVRQPDNPQVRLRYAMALASLKRFDDARRQCDELLRQDPHNVAAEIAMAKVTSWDNDLPGALRLYDKILARDPKNYDARVGKAFTLMWLRRNDEARKLFETAAREAPDDADVATALRTLGDSKQP